MKTPWGCCAAPSLVNRKFPTFKKDRFFLALNKGGGGNLSTGREQVEIHTRQTWKRSQGRLSKQEERKCWESTGRQRGCAARRSTADGITLPEFHTPTFHVGGRWSEIAYNRHNNGEPFLWKQIVDALGSLSIVSRILIRLPSGSPQLCEMSKLCSQACC